jgi:hypothetical protein
MLGRRINTVIIYIYFILTELGKNKIFCIDWYEIPGENYYILFKNGNRI